MEAPPSNDAEAFQVGKILQGLRRQPDLAIDVLTAETPAGEHTDLASLLQQDSEASHSSQVLQLPCRLRRWHRILLLLLAPWLARRPDWSFLFTWQANRAIRQLQQKPQLIYSRAFPLSSHLLALKLARFYQVPWFLHLSDPWCESSLEPSWNRSHWHRRQESRCLHAASRISFTSSVTFKRYQQRYPGLADRMVLDFNVYDEANLQPGTWTPGRRFRVVHTGSFTAERPVDSLLRALASLPSEHPLFADLELLQAGHSTPHCRRLIRKAGPWMQDLGLVTASHALLLQCQADLLLAIDWQFDRARDSQFLLSKLTDYLALRRPVLVITHPCGASGEFVITNRLGKAVSHDDPEGITAAIVAYWKAWKARDCSQFELPAPSGAYSSSRVSAGIANEVRATLNPGNANFA